MKFKLFCKYLLAGSLITFPSGIEKFHDTDTHNDIQIKTNIPTVQERINDKAKNLCDTYIDFVLRGQENIKSHYTGHRKMVAVRQELPGAPAGLYCMFGQYMQLNRALDKMGDTLTIVPFTSRNACPRFRNEMRKKYNTPEYSGAIHDGKMFRSDIEYNRALAAFLKHKHVSDSTDAQKRNSVIAKFEKNNFKASSLHPGTIIIVQHDETPSNTHAIMYLGRGRVKNNKFVADDNGGFIYAGYNNESVGDIFKTYNTNHIFAADIYNIAVVDYAKELNKIINMSHDDLFQFVYDAPMDMYYATQTNMQLEKLAMEKYFNPNFSVIYPVIRPNVARVPYIFPNILNVR